MISRRVRYSLVLFLLAGFAGAEDYAQRAREAYPADRYLIQIGSGASSTVAEQSAQDALASRLESVLTDAVERSRQPGAAGGLARSVARMSDVQLDWRHWIRTEPQWTSSATGTWQALAVVPLGDLRNELERLYEAQAVSYRVLAQKAKSEPTMAGFLEAVKSAQPRWPEMVHQALFMACLVPLRDGQVSLTAILNDDRKHPYAPWGSDQELHARLNSMLVGRFKSIKLRSNGPLSRGWASSSQALLSRSGIPAVADKSAVCRAGLRLDLSDDTSCEEVSLGWKCEAKLSWELQECSPKDVATFKRGDLPSTKVLDPRGERQARQELSRKVEAAGCDSLLLVSLRDALPVLSD